MMWRNWHVPGAVAVVIIGLLVDLVAVLAVIAIVKLAQHWLVRQVLRRRQPAAVPGS